MPEIMDESISRRKYLRYIGAGIAAALGAGIGYYYFEYKRRPVIPSISTTTISTSTFTQGSTLNPVVQYALEKGIDAGVANRLGVLDELNENNKTLVDYLYSVKNFYGDLGMVKALQLEVLDGANGFPGILTDDKVSDEEASALHYLSRFDREVQRSYIEFGLGGDVSKYLAMNSSLVDRDFAKWSTERKFLIQDHKLTDLKINCLNEPEKYGVEVLKSFITEIKSSQNFSDLGDELEKLPEVREALDKSDVKTNESVEDIVYSILMSKNPELIRKNLDRILSEGIMEKRKYCTPLQALEWYYVDREPDRDNPLENPFFINLKDFVTNVWRNSSISSNYKSDRWKNFDEVVDRLNSPDLVSIYTHDNIKYRSESVNEYVPARVVFERGYDDCDGFAIFQSHLLRANGYDAWVVGLSIETIKGHNVCGYKVGDKIRVLDVYGEKQGPFNSWEEVNNFYSEKGWALPNGSIRLLNPFVIKKRVTDYTSPNVLSLPWIRIR